MDKIDSFPKIMAPEPLQISKWSNLVMKTIFFALFLISITGFASRSVLAGDGAKASEICGTIAGIDCAKCEFCEFPVGECGVADQAGVCMAMPEECTNNIAPVCGCDGNTYENDCVRMKARAQKAHDGKCEAG